MSETLATKLFDFEEFGRKYENGNKIVKDFAELGQILANSKPEEICQPSTSKAEKQNIQQERKPIEKVVPVSPGQRLV